MIASLILFGILLVILGFYGLVRVQVASCEGGVYHAPLTSADEWSASLDVALGLDMFSCTEEEQVDHMWDMVPMADAWVGATHTMVLPVTKAPTQAHTMGRMHAYYSLRQMCYV